MQIFFRNPKLTIASVFLTAIICGFLALDLKITFDFEQFFPENDADLEYYRKFTDEFEKDDNFLLVAFKNEGKTIFDTSFLQKVDLITDSILTFSTIQKAQSITNLKTPVKTPFGYTLIPSVHINDNIKLQEDRNKLVKDERYIGSFINEKNDAISIVIKTKDDLNIDQCDSLIDNIKSLMNFHHINSDDYHLLGHSYFQSELVRLQKKEVLISTFISAILVFFILYFIFGRVLTATIAMLGIGLSLVIFMGLLSLFGRELSIMSALYPILILIVGSSDVIHLVSKYLDNDITEENKYQIMKKVVKEVGFATFLTSATNAVGFVTLLTSQLKVIRDFGVNAGFGVMLAFVVVIILVPCLLLLFKKEQLFKASFSNRKIHSFAQSAYNFGLKRTNVVLTIIILSSLVCIYGVTKITTDYKLIENLPRDEKVTADFMYFEKEFSGFRPFEIAIYAKQPYKINDYEIIKSIEAIETKLRSYEAIKNTISVGMIYKSLNLMENGNNPQFYSLPVTEEEFNTLTPIYNKMSKNEFNILVNKSNTATRISCKIEDIGADKVKILSADFEKWIAENVDKNKLEVRRTGTSLILDKNSEYVTKNIFQGLLLSILLISMLMALVVKNWKMLIVSLVPNLLPLLFVGAVLGFFGIELEAGISIIFAIIFGIAVDDTIHFVARYYQCLGTGLTVEQSLEATFKDTGKALVITSIILFFGFMVMLFSKSPASVTVGVLTAFTLVSALMCDLYLLPILIRKVFGKEEKKNKI